ncbi:hypothetical protein QUF50_07305 [Thiotrichales bacterium HSG1]|nr:hypothetical protein [Thiotrichales bacterium HSG1]
MVVLNDVVMTSKNLLDLPLLSLGLPKNYMVLEYVGKGAKTIFSLRTLVQSKGLWQQFWDKIQQYGTYSY